MTAVVDAPAIVAGEVAQPLEPCDWTSTCCEPDSASHRCVADRDTAQRQHRRRSEADSHVAEDKGLSRKLVGLGSRRPG